MSNPVISVRVNREIYEYFKKSGEPFSKTIPPILADYINKMKNKRCIQPVCTTKKHYEYQDIDAKIDALIRYKN